MSLLDGARDLQWRGQEWKRTQSAPYRAFEWDTLEKLARVMPSIVVALEAAVALYRDRENPITTDGETWHCAFCNAEQPDTDETDDESFPHEDDCPWPPFRAAMIEGGVTA